MLQVLRGRRRGCKDVPICLKLINYQTHFVENTSDLHAEDNPLLKSLLQGFQDPLSHRDTGIAESNLRYNHSRVQHPLALHVLYRQRLEQAIE